MAQGPFEETTPKQDLGKLLARFLNSPSGHEAQAYEATAEIVASGIGAALCQKVCQTFPGQPLYELSFKVCAFIPPATAAADAEKVMIEIYRDGSYVGGAEADLINNTFLGSHLAPEHALCLKRILETRRPDGVE